MAKKTRRPLPVRPVHLTPAFDRCVRVTIGSVTFDLKVIGERDDATTNRNLLLAALTLGAPVLVEAPAPATAA